MQFEIKYLTLNVTFCKLNNKLQVNIKIKGILRSLKVSITDNIFFQHWKICR